MGGCIIAYLLSYPLVISYRNYQKSVAYFSLLAPSILFFLLKGGVKRGEGAWHNGPPKYALVSTFRLIKVLMIDFQKNGLNKKKVFVVRGEALYFSEALDFSLPSLLVNPALTSMDHVFQIISYLTYSGLQTCCVK